jgi:hypothetical protein
VRSATLSDDGEDVRDRGERALGRTEIGDEEDGDDDGE